MHELANKVDILYMACANPSNDLDVFEVFVKYVPRVLSDEQK
jgi:hypothetical protein